MRLTAADSIVGPVGSLRQESDMEAIIFEIVTKAALLLAGIIGLAVWHNAGCPVVTIRRR